MAFLAFLRAGRSPRAEPAVHVLPSEALRLDGRVQPGRHDVAPSGCGRTSYCIVASVTPGGPCSNPPWVQSHWPVMAWPSNPPGVDWAAGASGPGGGRAAGQDTVELAAGADAWARLRPTASSANVDSGPWILGVRPVMSRTAVVTAAACSGDVAAGSARRSPGVPWRLIAACRECELALADLTLFIKELIRHVLRRRGSRTSSGRTSLAARLRGSRAAGLQLASRTVPWRIRARSSRHDNQRQAAAHRQAPGR